jgi:hypothetical protein
MYRLFASLSSVSLPSPGSLHTCSAYPALVQTLVELFDRSTHPGGIEEFLMSWNRRIASTSIFFDLMTKAGFIHEHLGKCIYSFRRYQNHISGTAVGTSS